MARRARSRRRRLVLSVGLVTACWAVQAEQPTAWDVLIKTSPARLQGLVPAEETALRSMSPGELDRLTRGAATRDVLLLSGEPLSDFLLRQGVSAFGMRWHSSDNGADRLSAAAFTLAGTFGQADAGRLSGGEFALEGGFATRSRAEIEGFLFNDGFESGTTQRWSAAAP